MKVIKEQCTYSSGTVGGFTYFTLISDVKPTDSEIAESQIRLGYHPAGYGGPWNIKTEKLEDGTFETKWTCAGSCD